MRIWLQKTLLRAAMKLGGQDAETKPSVSFEAAAARTIRDGRDESEAGRAQAEEAESPAGYRQMVPRGHLPSPLGTALLLAAFDDDVFVPVFVGPSEALAFRHRLAGRPYARPLSYDLIDRLLALTGGHVSEVRIEQLRADRFIATIVLSLADGSSSSLDARASDAIILAMGSGAPIFVAEAVVAHTGRPLGDLSKI